MEPEVPLPCSQHSETCPVLSQIKPLHVPQCISLWYLPIFSYLHSVNLNDVFPSSPPPLQNTLCIYLPHKSPHARPISPSSVQSPSRYQTFSSPVAPPPPHALISSSVRCSQNPSGSFTSTKVKFWSAHNSVSYYGSPRLCWQILSVWDWYRQFAETGNVASCVFGLPCVWTTSHSLTPSQGSEVPIFVRECVHRC